MHAAALAVSSGIHTRSGRQAALEQTVRTTRRAQNKLNPEDLAADSRHGASSSTTFSLTCLAPDSVGADSGVTCTTQTHLRAFIGEQNTLDEAPP